jgi:homoserine kinase
VSARIATAFAPASIGNVAVGFDLLGQSFDGAGDRATVRRTDDGQVRMAAIRGVVRDLPPEAAANTAGRALLALVERRPSLGFEIELDKGIPLGSGMGGSAASAVAALVAANATLDDPLDAASLYALALEGEFVASGSRHGDNVGPALLGGLVLAPAEGAPIALPVPSGLWCAVVHPHLVVATRDARKVLGGPFALPELVSQTEGLALVLTGCFRDDVELVRRGLRDVLVEPRRASLIPGFADVKTAALQVGALGASISGAGPSVFAWLPDRAAAERAAAGMVAAFARAGLAADPYVSPVAGPKAKVLSCTA